jgi:hypothetical protein
MRSSQVYPVPAQSPLHAAKNEPSVASADNVTVEPAAIERVHIVEQRVPPGWTTTAPCPEVVIDSSYEAGGGGGPKAAVTSVESSISNAHVVPLPAGQGADQPTNLQPAAGCALSVTGAPKCSVVEHVASGQSMAAPSAVTRPRPEILTERVGIDENVATAARAPVMRTRQVAPWPPQLPLQRRRDAPTPGSARRVANLPTGNRIEQVPVHRRPPGSMLTAPEPVAVTVSRCSRSTVTTMRESALRFPARSIARTRRTWRPLRKRST